MLGKVINIKDKNLVSFFYPDFKVQDNVYPLDCNKNIIYVGQPYSDLKEWLSSSTKNFISLSGRPDLDLTSNKALVDWVESKTKPMSNSSKEILLGMEDDDFYRCLKQYYLISQSEIKETEQGSSFEVFKALITKPLQSVIKTFYEQAELSNVRVIESGLLTMLLKSKNYQTVMAKPGYLKMLQEANNLFKNRYQIIPELLTRDIDPELRVLALLIGLKGG